MSIKHYFIFIFFIGILCALFNTKNLCLAKQQEENISTTTNISTINIPIEEFTSLKIQGAINIKVTVQKNVSPELTVNIKQSPISLTKNNLHETFEIKSSNNTLLISGSKINNVNAEFFLTTPTLKILQLKGANNISISEVKSDNFAINCSGANNVKITATELKTLCGEFKGASNIELTGNTNSLDITLAGSNNFNSKNLKVKNVIAKIRGANIVKLFCSENLERQISGSNICNFYGNPQKISGAVSGVSIIHIN